MPLLVYTEDGRESVNSNKLPLLAKVKKNVGYRSTARSSGVFPLTGPATVKPSRDNFSPYANRAEEFKGLVFMKPSNIANGVHCFTYYSTSDVNTFYSVADLGNNGNYNLDIIMADLDDVARVKGYINIYADDLANTLMWSLETFRCGINVLGVVPINQVLITFPIPSWVDKNDFYVSVPHSVIYNQDNGTDSTWDVSEIGFQIIGNTAYVKCMRSTQNGQNQNPPPDGFLVFAMISKALTNTNITS